MHVRFAYCILPIRFFVTGAIEAAFSLGQPHTFKAKLRQAEKEAVALWILNAQEGHFEPVHITLCDGQALLRVTFAREKGLKAGVPAFTTGMKGTELRGKLRCRTAFIVM